MLLVDGLEAKGLHLEIKPILISLGSQESDKVSTESEVYPLIWETLDIVRERLNERHLTSGMAADGSDSSVRMKMTPGRGTKKESWLNDNEETFPLSTVARRMKATSRTHSGSYGGQIGMAF